MTKNVESGKLPNGSKCSSCGANLDMFTGISEDGGGPSDGDITVCGMCGVIGVYENQLTSIRELDAEELRKVKLEEKELWDELMIVKQAADRVISRRNGTPPDLTTDDGVRIYFK